MLIFISFSSLFGNPIFRRKKLKSPVITTSKCTTQSTPKRHRSRRPRRRRSTFWSWKGVKIRDRPRGRHRHRFQSAVRLAMCQQRDARWRRLIPSNPNNAWSRRRCRSPLLRRISLIWRHLNWRHLRNSFSHDSATAVRKIRHRRRHRR